MNACEYESMLALLSNIGTRLDRAGAHLDRLQADEATPLGEAPTVLPPPRERDTEPCPPPEPPPLPAGWARLLEAWDEAEEAAAGLTLDEEAGEL